MREVDQAYQACRRHKRSKPDAIAYQAPLLDQLFATRDALNQGRWRPSPGTVFITTRPKLRQVHAAPFADRVTQHLVVAGWQPLLEPGWIAHSYANRIGKGSYAAVTALQRMVRSAAAQHRGACYLKLDIANFFHSIDIERLRARLAESVRKHLKRGAIDRARAVMLWRATVSILDQDCAASARKRGPPKRFAAVPLHKRLGALGPGKGLPIGNLTSQFFGNVVLDQLDQYIKHVLKVRWYVRYVDDFVLLAADAQTLAQWRCSIGEFLHERLCLQLKAGSRPLPIRNGIDFLGYILRPQYRLARRRVVRRCWGVLCAFESRHLRKHRDGVDVDLRHAPALQSQLASYLGHFRHAASGRLWARLLRRFDWLDLLFLAPERAMGAGAKRGLQPRWRLPSGPQRLSAQLSQFRRRLRALARMRGLAPIELLFQCGNRWRRHGSSPRWLSTPQMQACCRALRAARRSFAVIVQCGVQRDGRRTREIRHLSLVRLPLQPLAKDVP